jgi:1-acyl-sn-glycerol-3-phosphate acyltransferase
MILLRSFLASLLFLILTVVFSTLAIIASFFDGASEWERRTIQIWGRLTCGLFGVKVKVFGMENWPFDRGAIILFNHTSFFDIFAMVGFLPDMRFGAKKELFKIPFFGPAMRRVGVLPIDRASRDRVYQVYERSTERLKSGKKITLAPEGTRTDSPLELQKFKAGPFLFALQAEVDLVPVVVHGAYDVMKKYQILPQTKVWRSEILLSVLPPVKTKGFTFHNRAELQVLVKDQMQRELHRLVSESTSSH